MSATVLLFAVQQSFSCFELFGQFFAPHVFFLVLFFRRTSNGDTENQELWNYSHTSLSGLHNHHVFAPFPIFAVDQPLEMTKHSLDPTRSVLLIPGSSTSRQQVRLIRSEAFMCIFMCIYISGFTRTGCVAKCVPMHWHIELSYFQTEQNKLHSFYIRIVHR